MTRETQMRLRTRTKEEEKDDNGLDKRMIKKRRGRNVKSLSDFRRGCRVYSLRVNNLAKDKYRQAANALAAIEQGNT